ncbi:MAG: bifunctional serine/threonine-protein kinase/formylglycine-generating enzyme family protein [Planctomycetota bacterium]
MTDESLKARPIEPGRTEVQTQTSQEISAELSIPGHVQSHPSAPRLPGYILTKQLGEGAYGQVWHAWQHKTRKEVAVKVFTHRSGLDWILLQREVERLARLDRHPHIVTLLDTQLEQEPPFYAMDLLESGSLDQWVRPERPAPLDRVMAWLDQICSALSYVHAKGLIHCDLKPANILLDEQDRARIVDFGQSRIFSESGASIGTLFFMPPEQAIMVDPQSPAQPDVRWDVYALGATMHAIATGQVPYATPEVSKQLSTASNLAERLDRYRCHVLAGSPAPWNVARSNGKGYELEAISRKCMAIKPEARYSSIEAVAEDLRNLRRNRPISPLSKSTGYRFKKFAGRNPFGLAFGVAVVALLSAAVGVHFQRMDIDRLRASEIVATFVDDPDQAIHDLSSASGRLRDFVADVSARYVHSANYTERVMGARSGLFTAPNEFWESVSSGVLGRHGEWLEFALNDWNLQTWELLSPQLETKLTSGSNVEKYVALCLLGQHRTDDKALVARCAEIAQSPGDPGVVAAAWWAAQQMGQSLNWQTSDRIFVDDLTGLVFMRIPRCESFKRGSDLFDRDRWPDETTPAEEIPIGPIHMSATEVTLASFGRFLIDAEKQGLINAKAVEKCRAVAADVPEERHAHVAAGSINARAARAFCDWLNNHAGAIKPRRRYRLPTEDEWEYACRAGNAGRFCYGDDPKYARYFAHCDGSAANYHEVAKRMPNAFGLFDMHGGLWELTDSPYPPEEAERAGLSDPKAERIVTRGGAFNNPAVRCRSAQKNCGTHDYVAELLGFRLVMELQE